MSEADVVGVETIVLGVTVVSLRVVGSVVYPGTCDWWGHVIRRSTVAPFELPENTADSSNAFKFPLQKW